MSKVIPLAVEALKQAELNKRPARLVGHLDDVIDLLRPSRPLYIYWPERIGQAARAFTRAFPGETMYAVKTNPNKSVLQALSRGGVRSFDAASIEEIRLVRKTLPKARIYFMHPVKAPEAINEAYHVHGVRDFVLDSEEELYKIIRETDLAAGLNLYVRIALPKNGKAAIDFSSKFGALPDEAIRLLQRCRPVADTLGVSFHVGTQSCDPNVYGKAVSVAAGVIRKSGVKVDMLDVGGGYPVPYPGEECPAIESCIDSLKKALVKEKLSHLPLLAEPGRALVAQGGALIARVELRKGNTLYLNDGTYGGLFDAGPLLKTKYPVRVMRARDKQPLRGAPQAFRFAGPTCDSLDMMEGPFMLPSDIGIGDWIEIGNLGAYSQGMRSNFNGFGTNDTLCLYDDPTKA
jgi:ornithine decarboxylase